jgi:hypothetical protein
VCEGSSNEQLLLIGFVDSMSNVISKFNDLPSTDLFLLTGFGFSFMHDVEEKYADLCISRIGKLQPIAVVFSDLLAYNYAVLPLVSCYSIVSFRG